MEWEKLTAPEFVKALEKTEGVCIIPLGSIEKHGEHLPTGTDSFVIHRIAVLASEIEPAIVFPAVRFTENREAKFAPGGVALKTEVYFRLLENICEEVSRNGFKKIILLSGHGGNRFFLPFFLQHILEERREYAVYLVRTSLDPEIRRRVMETEFDYHAGEFETSLMLHICPELVKVDAIPETPANPLERSEVKPDLMTPVDWFSDYPRHYAGDARPASPEKGRILIKNRVSNLVEAIRKVKADESTAAVMKEFMDKSENPTG